MKALWVTGLILLASSILLASRPRQAACNCLGSPVHWAPASASFFLSVGPFGNVYATNNMDNAVTVYSSGGGVQARWVVPGVAGNAPVVEGVAVDAAGNIYVADASNSRVAVLGPGGQYMRSLSAPGTDAGQFLMPFDIALGHDNDLFVVDAFPANTRVLRFRLDGRFLNEWPVVTQNGLYDIAVDTDGTVYGTQWPGSAPVEVRSPTGTLLRTWNPGTPGEQVSTGRIEARNGLVFVSVVAEATGSPVSELRVFDSLGNPKCATGISFLGALAIAPGPGLYMGSPDRQAIDWLDLATPAVHRTWGALKLRYR